MDQTRTLAQTSLLILASILSSCATRAAYEVGNRRCLSPAYPEVSAVGSSADRLYISFKCHDTELNYLIKGGRLAGESTGVADLRLKDLFHSSAAPVGLSAGGLSWNLFHPRKRIPVLERNETPTEELCQFVTGASPDYLFHSKCGTEKGTAQLRNTMDGVAKGFYYRKKWAYPLLPILIPVGLAVDVIASPVWFMYWYSRRYGHSTASIDGDHSFVASTPNHWIERPATR